MGFFIGGKDLRCQYTNTTFLSNKINMLRLVKTHICFNHAGVITVNIILLAYWTEPVTIINIPKYSKQINTLRKTLLFIICASLTLSIL